MWALDLGTTNSALARWDKESRRPVLMGLPEVGRRADPGRLMDAPRVVPSVAEALPRDLWSNLGSWGPIRKNAFLGTLARIGQPALDANDALPSPAFATSFKTPLSTEPTRPVARLGDDRLTARDMARLFLRELFAEVKQAHGERIRDLTLTAPVGSFDTYRAELKSLVEELGVRRPRFLDEPVAAALGYGLGLDRERRVLVFDMGGGTLHTALVMLSPRGLEQGACEVLGKTGNSVGGDTVDRWLLRAFCKDLGVRMPDPPADESDALWMRLVLDEARRVKEEVHFAEQATFVLTAPEELRGQRARLGGKDHHLVVSRARVMEILEQNGLYAAIDASVEAALEQGGPEVDEVLLVGGSSLLPGVFQRFESRFGRDHIRGWQPFEAVVLGAATFAGGGFAQSDFIVHDYALVTHDAANGSAQHTVVVPSGTRFPTRADLWRRQLVPTCALGEPETFFKLVVCEISRSNASRRFSWDASGTLRVMDKDEAVVVPLNAANPTLGTLDPPHPPGDRKPRLDVSFGVDENRWLVATVVDLKTGKALLKDEAVVKLL